MCNPLTIHKRRQPFFWLFDTYPLPCGNFLLRSFDKFFKNVDSFPLFYGRPLTEFEWKMRILGSINLAPAGESANGPFFLNVGQQDLRSSQLCNQASQHEVFENWKKNPPLRWLRQRDWNPTGVRAIQHLMMWWNTVVDRGSLFF